LRDQKATIRNPQFSLVLMFSGGILLNDLVAHLLRCQLLIFLQPVSQQGFINTDGAARGMVVFETRVKALVPECFIAFAITGQLSQSLRNLLGYLVCFPRLADEF